MRIAAPLLLLAALTVAPAQEGWLVPFAAAYQPDVGGFNAAFAGAEPAIPEAHVRQYGWGLELRSNVNGFLVGPLFFRTWDDVENENYQLRTDATAIMGEVGLKITPFSFLTIIPMVAVGGLSQSFNIRTKSRDISLDSLLHNPGRNASIASGMKLAGMGALELGLSTPTGSGRYGVALRVGYLYSPMTVGWHLSNGAEINNAPGTKLGGPVFSLGFLLLPAPETSTPGF